MDQINDRPGRLVLPAQEHLGIPALYVHDLTGSLDAEQLLSVPPPVHPMSAEVLPRLRQLNPELTSQFVEKDEVEKIPFKLMTTNQVWVPGEFDSFVAISYCWHSPDWEVPSRFNDQQQDWDFPISPAMLNAVFARFFYQSGSTTCFAMWIDQMCIDQDDADEKFHAIASLDTIYRNAVEVIILLEDVDISLDEDLALSMLALRKDDASSCAAVSIGLSEVGENMQKCIDTGYGDAVVQILSKLFRSRWFTRAWCRHEDILSSHTTFIMIGRQVACIALDTRAIVYVVDSLRKNCVDQGDVVRMPAFQDFCFGINCRIFDYTKDNCQFELFVRLQLLSCSYQRDIISICLNASGIRLSFSGDVAHQRECRYILSMIAISAGDALVLGAEGMPMHRMKVPGHQPLLPWP